MKRLGPEYGERQPTPPPWGAGCQFEPWPSPTCSTPGTGPAIAGPMFDRSEAECTAIGAVRASAPARANSRMRNSGLLFTRPGFAAGAIPAYGGHSSALYPIGMRPASPIWGAAISTPIAPTVAPTDLAHPHKLLNAKPARYPTVVYRILLGSARERQHIRV